MENNNITNQAYQLIKDYCPNLPGFAINKSLLVVGCFIMWAQKQNDESNEKLIGEIVRDFSFIDGLNVMDYQFEEDYSTDECVSTVKALINEDSYEIEDAMYSSSSSLNELIIQLIDLKDNESFCDFGSGDGKLLMNVADYANQNQLHFTYTGYELHQKHLLVSKCLMKMLGIDASIINSDYAIEEIENQFDKGYLYPTFGLRYSMLEWDTIKRKYSELFNSRHETELFYLLKTFETIKKDGKLIVVLPNGATFRQSGMLVRKYLIENQFLEGIISLPGKTLCNTTAPVDIWILSKSEKSINQIQMLDATNMIVNSNARNNISLNVPEIIDAYKNNSKKISGDELKANEYSLSLSTYEVASLKNSIPYPLSLSEVCTIEKGSQYTLGRFKKQVSDVPTNYQLLTSINIQDGIVDFDSLTYIKPDTKLLKFKLEEGDIVITTKSTVVKTYVARNLPDRNIIVTGGMIILKPDTFKINPTYLKMFLDSSIGKKQFKAIGKGTVVITIPYNEFKDKMIISCPSLDKQNELADEYNKMLNTINVLTKQLEETKSGISNIIEDIFVKK